MNDYDLLRDYLKKQKLPEFVLSFDQIEEIIDAALPRAAPRPLWWAAAPTPPEQLCLVGLWAYNPPALLNAVQGKSLAGKVKIVGFDEDVETLGGIESGAITGTIVQQPFEFGYQAVKLMTSLARGDKSVLPSDGILYVPHETIRKENVAAFREKLEKLRSG